MAALRSSRLALVLLISSCLVFFSVQDLPAQTETPTPNRPLRAEKPPIPLPQGSAQVTLSTSEPQRELGALPIHVTLSEIYDGSPLTIQAATLDRQLANDLSPFGFAFTLETDLPDESAAALGNLPLELTLDYSRIPLRYGASIEDRLTLYRVSGCELETVNTTQAGKPAREGQFIETLSCAHWDPLPLQNDRAAEQLVVDLSQVKMQEHARQSIPGAGESLDPLIGPSYFVMSTTAAGQQGDYSYTPLSAVSEGEVALSSGAMTTSYSIPVPPPRAGDAPDIRLNYNSGIIDGMHTSKNNQPGSVGIGWTLQNGAIIRHLKTCGYSWAPGDLCLTGDNYSIILNGVKSRLVKESSSLYRLQEDPRWKVEKLTSSESGHPTTHKTYWLVTTPDGTQFRFGGEIVPETDADQDSVFYTTIYDTTTNGCSGYAYGLCDMAWQWNLDRVEDTNGNVTNYFYEQETNYYKARNYTSTTFRRLYVRAGHVLRIEYTTTAGQTDTPHARVLFNTEMRCINPTATSGCSWPTDFPDTPGDLACAATGSCSQNKPTFWSQRRVGSIQTQFYNDSADRWQMVGHYNLDQGFPAAPTDGQGDASESKLWLGGVSQHPGGDFARWAFIQNEAEDYDLQSGIDTEVAYDVGQGRNVGWADDNDYIAFESVNFDAGATSLVARVASIYSGRSIEFRLDSTSGPLVATINVPYTGGWQNWQTVSATVSGATGIHDLYLVFKNSGMNLNWFRFSPHFGSGSPHPGLPAVVYNYEMLANRRNYSTSGVSPMFMPRVDKITTELGGQVDITYGQSHACPSSSGSGYIRYPYDCFVAWDTGDPNVSWDDGWVLWNKWKVLQQQSSDTFSGNETESLSFSYSTPVSHYSDDPSLPDINSCSYCHTRHWNDFRGSEIVTVTDSSGAKTEHRFYRGMNGDRYSTSGGSYSASITLSDSSTRTDSNWLRGRPAEVRRLTSGSSALTRTVNWYSATGTAGSGTYGAYFVGLQKSEETLYGSNNKTTRMEYVYDSYGNITREIRHGDTATTSDDRNIETSYVYNTSAYIVDRAQWSKLWTGTSSGSAGNEQSYVAYAYDGQSIGTAPSTGNLTLERAFWQTTPTTQYSDSTMTYDSAGRPTTVTDANSNTTTTSYHSIYGYAASVTNDLNHTTTTVMDPGWGVPTEVTDPNNNVTTIEYDEYGRLIKVWLATEPTNGPASQEYIYHPEARPAYVQSRQLIAVGSSTYLNSWSYVDGFGRDLQSQRPSENGGQRVVSSQQHNDLGQLYRQSAPYEISGAAGSGYVQPTWSSLDSYHRFSYDDLGRATLDELLSGSSVLWSSSQSYQGWTTTTTDANGHATDQETDAFGQLVEVTEYNDEGSGQVAYTTEYVYDVAGNLTSVTDHLSNTATMTYDLLGRKTAMSDPDMGSWTYQYDGVGNLTAQQDGRGLWVYMTYDDLNRLTAKRRDNVSGSLIAEYFYDSGDKGQLDSSKAYAANGTTVNVEVQYLQRDDRYRVTQQQWLVNGQGTFKTAYGYDEADNLVSFQYPANNSGGLGETVTRSFNNVGQLDQVISQQDSTHFLDNASYEPTGQPAGLRLDQSSNGATISYSYESGSLRLQQKQTGSGSGGTIDRQDLTYVYDDGGNVTSITDALNSSQVQTFGYDWLDRLTSASTNAVGTGQYTHTYAYDAIGNLTNYNGSSYTYSATQPHAVTAAFGNSYGYDANANQTSRTISSTTYTQVFDYENRLVEVKQGATPVASFIYDADGNRIVGTVSGTTTVYIAGLFEYQAGAMTRYYAGPNGPIALRRVGYGANNGIFYVLGDQLNSTSVILNQNGSISAQQFYYPFGGNRGGAFSPVTTKRFTGQYHEAGLPGGEGLSYYNARWYDAQLGRFVSADTIVPDPGNPQSLNRLAYVLNNPLRFTDPSGNRPCGQDCSTPLRHNALSNPGLVSFSGQSWNLAEQNTVITAAWRTANTLATTYNANAYKIDRVRSTNKWVPSYGRMDPLQIFRRVYGGPARFTRVNEETPIVNGQRVYGVYVDRRIGVRTYRNANISVKWAVHELGHAFEARVNRGTPYFVRNRLQATTSIRRRDPSALGHTSGFADRFPIWQRSMTVTPGEEFADMYLGWTYNRWEAGNEQHGYSPQGLARSNFMKQNMPFFINLAMRR